MDKYSILRKLGQGTYGSVYLCEQKDTGRQCVMKRMLLRNLSEKERHSALQEAQLLESLNHPNIVAYVDTVCTRSKLYLLMQYCDGGDLERKLNEVRKENGVVPETQVLDWFVQMALALQYLHSKRILHRDLKTANVFLTAIGIVKLGDFGVSRVLSATSELAKTFVGTPYYLSPELLNNSPYGHASDVWALGVIFYEMCTLEHPYEAKTFPALAQKILYDPPPCIGPKRPCGQVEQLEKLSAAMLCKDSTARPSLPELLEYDLVQARMQAFVEEAQLTAARAPLTPHGHARAGASPAGRSSFASLESDETAGSPYAYGQARQPLAEDPRALDGSYASDGGVPPAGRSVGEYEIRHAAAGACAAGEYAAGGYATGGYAAGKHMPRAASAMADGQASMREQPLVGVARSTDYPGDPNAKGGAGPSVLRPAAGGARSAFSLVDSDAAVCSPLNGSGGGIATPFKRGSRRLMSSSMATGAEACSLNAARAATRSASDQSAACVSCGQVRPLTPDERLAEIDRKQRELQVQMSQLQHAKHNMELEASKRVSPNPARAGEPALSSFAASSMPREFPHGVAAGGVGVDAGGAYAGHAARPSGGKAAGWAPRPTLPPSPSPACATLYWPRSTVEAPAGLAGPAAAVGLPEQPAESVKRSLEEWNECFAGGVRAPRMQREGGGTGGGLGTQERDDDGVWSGDAPSLSTPLLETLRDSTLRQSSGASLATPASGAEEYEDDFESDDEVCATGSAAKSCSGASASMAQALSPRHIGKHGWPVGADTRSAWGPASSSRHAALAPTPRASGCRRMGRKGPALDRMWKRT